MGVVELARGIVDNVDKVLESVGKGMFMGFCDCG